MSRPIAIGVHIYAGGFTLGVRRHFNVLAQLEDAPHYAGAVCRANFPRLRIYEGDWPADPPGGSVDFIYGNPPCAPWSNARSHHRQGVPWHRDPRVDCLKRQFQLLERWEPNAWAWESVTRAYTAGRRLVDDLTERATQLGYDVYYVLHDARYLGVAQIRRRFFFVASRYEMDWSRPRLCPELTVRDALGGIRSDPRPRYKTLRGGEGGLIPHCRPGERLVDTWQRLHGDRPETWERGAQGGIKGKPSFLIHKPKWNGPANTQLGRGTIHPGQARFLAVNELAALCGYPPDFQWHVAGKTTSGRADMVTRGVCPPVGAWLAGHVSRALRRGVPSTSRVQEVDLRKPPVVINTLQGAVPLDLED